MQILLFDKIKVASITKVTLPIWFSNHTNEQRVVNNIVLLKEFCVFANVNQQFLSFFGLKDDRRTFLKIIIFFGCQGINVSCFPTYPWSLYVIPLNYSLFGVKHVSHNHKVTSTNFFAFFIFFNKLMQAIELCDHRIWILFKIVIIILENCSQKFNDIW